MKPCNKKTVFIGLLIIITMTSLAGYVIFKQFDFNEVANAIKQCNILWLIPALLCMLAFSMGEAININQGLKLAGYKVGPANSIKYAFAGFFFSSITPSASGGQPAQLYYMSRDKINISHSSFSLLLELIGFEIGSITLGFLGILVSVFSDIPVFEGSNIVWLAIVGFMVNFILLAVLLIIMFSRKAVKVLACFAIKITSLFSKKKDSKRSILRLISEYRLAAIKARNNKKVLFKIILVSLLRLLAYHSITFFTYKALGLYSQSYFEIALLQGLLFTSVSCIPLPGSSGAMEGGFGILFKSIFPSSLLGSAIILTRTINFAVPLIYTGISLLFLPRRKAHSKTE